MLTIRCDTLRYDTAQQVGRCKSSGIRDHHVSRRHVEVTVPSEGEDGAQEGEDVLDRQRFAGLAHV